MGISDLIRIQYRKIKERIYHQMWYPRTLEARRQEPRYARLHLCTPHCGGASPFSRRPRPKNDHSGRFCNRQSDIISGSTVAGLFSSNSLKRKKYRQDFCPVYIFLLPKLDSNQYIHTISTYNNSNNHSPNDRRS